MARAAEHRFTDELEYEVAFRDLFLVACPRCGACARVEASELGQKVVRGAIFRYRFVCPSCGLSHLPESTHGGWRGPGIASAGGRCGRCGQWVRRERRLQHPPAYDELEVACRGCGARTRFAVHWDSDVRRGIKDPELGLPLWLQVPCCGEVLWAYNTRHLRFLEGYVAATLRERVPNVNGSLASRLPRWMKRASNRNEVLRGLAELQRRTLGR